MSSSGDITEILKKLLYIHGLSMPESIVIVEEAKKKLGKLSTPRLTDKVYIGISKCCDAPAWFTDKNASGNPISVCDKCEKVCNMYKPNKPRLMEECPECAKLRGKIALLMSERPDMILENAKLRKKIDDLYEMGKKDCCTGKKPSEGVNK
jgi:hypothetical protein